MLYEVVGSHWSFMKIENLESGKGTSNIFFFLYVPLSNTSNRPSGSCSLVSREYVKQCEFRISANIP